MFEYKNLNRKLKNINPVFELLNAIGILDHMDWKSLFDLYVQILHTYTYGPSEDEKNIRCLLKETGYSESFDFSKFNGYALVQRGKHYYALIQEGKDAILYGILNPDNIDELEEYRIFYKDFNYTYEKNIRKKDTRNVLFNTSHHFNYSNINPNGNLTGDCSIKALAYGLRTDWHSALDELAKQGYKMNELHFNYEDIVEKVLVQHGFEKHKHFPVRLTCKQFCQKMDSLYEDADILLLAGKNHITALKKVNSHYQIQDSWDCSNELAGNYYVKEKSVDEKQLENLEDAIIIHPSFGEGIVYKQEQNKLYISFNDVDKVLSLDWVCANCKIIAS